MLIYSILLNQHGRKYGISNLSTDQSPEKLAADLRRAFSGIVAVT